MKNIYKYAFYLMLFALLGFSREFLFVNINQYLYSLYYHFQDPYLPASLSFLQNFSYETLYYTKFILTLFYFAVYFFVNYFAVKTITNKPSIYKLTTIIYFFILVIAILLTLYNYFINKNLGGSVYTFSRWLMGIAQSPLIAFFMISTHKLYKKNESLNSK